MKIENVSTLTDAQIREFLAQEVERREKQKAQQKAYRAEHPPTPEQIEKRKAYHRQANAARRATINAILAEAKRRGLSA